MDKQTEIYYTINLGDLYVENYSLTSKQKPNDFLIHYFVEELKLTRNFNMKMVIGKISDAGLIADEIGGVVTKHVRETTVVETSEVYE